MWNLRALSVGEGPVNWGWSAAASCAVAAQGWGRPCRPRGGHWPSAVSAGVGRSPKPTFFLGHCESCYTIHKTLNKQK